MRISLVAALSRNFVIGVRGKLPWHIPEDLRRFKTVTQGHPIIMGRKTHDSIGRVLPHRENLIITRQPGYEAAPGAIPFTSLENALEYCHGKYADAFVVGGGEIYSLALKHLKPGDRLLLTLVDTEIEGDAFFPHWNPRGFRETNREMHPASATHPAFSFVTLIST